MHIFSDYSETATIKAAKNVSNDEDVIAIVLKGYEVFLHVERELPELSDDSNEEETNALMSELYRGTREINLGVLCLF